MSHPAIAQDAPKDKSSPVVLDDGIMLKEIIVYGVRASQERAIDIKRSSQTIVDSIVAEDIGKLPDLTITDSLQRIPGVQISRKANEGESLNVRGMPQVLTTLNGEQFLSPWSITSTGANYSDIPVGVISGVDVHKSLSADRVAGGISGIVDLKTFRPLDMYYGWTGNAKVELSKGQQSDVEYTADGETSRSPDKSLNLFVGYNSKDKWGVSVGAFTGTTYAANYQMVNDELHLGFLDAQGGSPSDPNDLNGDGDLNNDWYVVPSQFAVESRFIERERDGLSISFDSQLSETLSLQADIFYTRLDQLDRGVRAAFKGGSSVLAYNEDRRYLVDGEYEHYAPGEDVPDNAIDAYLAQESLNLYNVLTADTLTGASYPINYTVNGVNRSAEIHAITFAQLISPEFQTLSTSTIDRTEALNGSIALMYDNGLNFEMSLRYVGANAERQSRVGVLEQGSPAWFWRDDDFNSRKDPLEHFEVAIDYRGSIPNIYNNNDFSSADVLESYQARANGTNRDASLNVLRFDGTYIIDDHGINTVEFGLRHGVRKAENTDFFYMTPTGRYSEYEDPQVAEEDRFQLLEGNAVWERFPAFRRFDYLAEDQRLRDAGLINNGFNRDSVIEFDQFGPIDRYTTSGTAAPGVAAMSPALWDSPLNFMNQLYPGTRTVVDPSQDYEITETTTSAYAQLKFYSSDNFGGWPFDGDFGLRVVNINREVTRAVIPELLTLDNALGFRPEQQVAIDYTFETIDHSYTKVLPSFNINFDLGNDVVGRVGASRTLSPNDLDNLGSRLSVYYQTCDKTYIDENGVERVRYTETPTGGLVRETVGCVAGGSEGGNPKMEPWTADVFNTAVEWYMSDSALLSGTLFFIDVTDAVEVSEQSRAFVDTDGVDRGRRANIQVASNSGSSDLLGLEIGYKQPWTFTDTAILEDMGAEFNYTYSKSKSSNLDIQGNGLPLPSNSRHQTNLVLWYDDSELNVRLAYNWRSEEYIGRAVVNTNETELNLANWYEPRGYLDLSVNYWVNDNLGIYFNAVNLTETHQRSYTQTEDQFHGFWAQDRRFALGVTAKF